MSKLVLVFALTLSASLLGSGHARAQQPLAKEGVFGAGIGAVPVALGTTEVFSAGGRAFGVRYSAAAQIDLGPKWALRLPLVIAVASGGTEQGYAEIAVAPGVLYRFRSQADERFTPYVGGGVKLGGFGADRPLLGKPLLAAVQQPLDLDDHDGDHHHTDDPNFDSRASIGAELWLGASLHAGRVVTFDFELSGSLVPVDRVLVFGMAQTAALRVTF